MPASEPKSAAPREGKVDFALHYRRLERATRIGFLAVTLLFALIALYWCLAIPGVALIFADIFPGKNLPFITLMVLAGQPVLLVIACILPAVAFYLALGGIRTDYAIYGISLCSLLLVLMCFVIWIALYIPFIPIYTGLTPP